MPYTVRVDDNFHPMDEEHRYTAGEYGSYAEAAAVCRAMVDAHLRGAHRPGMSAEALIEHYRTFGEDPFITPDPPDGEAPFSAWAYADVRSREICG